MFTPKPGNWNVFTVQEIKKQPVVVPEIDDHLKEQLYELSAAELPRR